MTESKLPSYFGRPKAVEGPSVLYHKADDANPVFRGILLVIGAWLVSRLTFLQKYLWTNAGFGGLRGLQPLENYVERWDPTVIPLAGLGSEAPLLTLKSLPVTQEHLPGRYRSAAEYHKLYLSGELTPLAVAESLLPLIRRDVTLRSHHSVAFTDSNPESILTAARASTLRYQEGRPLSILDGIPTAIKDDSEVAGYRTTHGRKKNDSQFKIEENSTWPIQKLFDAGMIILGKLNMHEIGADTTNNNPNWGTPKNPYNDLYYTGGSSGGPAYAVAAGLIPFALGSDGGGSVRLPASFCGIYGLKPSHSRLEDTGSTVTVKGPLAATMSDLIASYRVLSQPNPSDPICALFAHPASPQTKTIGIYRPWFDRSDASVLKLCNETVTYYESKLGYNVVDITLPYLPEGQVAHAFTILSEMAVRARINPVSSSNWLKDLNPANQVLLVVGDQTPARDYLLAQQLRNMLMQHLAFLYQKYPGLIIVTPTTPMAGWPIANPGDLTHGFTDGNTSLRNMEYIWLANFAGNPAISCPVGYVEPVKGEGRVPVGIMAMGEWGAEEQLLEFGKECEEYLHTELKGGRIRAGNWEDVVANAKELMGKI